jgi:hypothetical protein
LRENAIACRLGSRIIERVTCSAPAEALLRPRVTARRCHSPPHPQAPEGRAPTDQLRQDICCPDRGTRRVIHAEQLSGLGWSAPVTSESASWGSTARRVPKNDQTGPDRRPQPGANLAGPRRRTSAARHPRANWPRRHAHPPPRRPRWTRTGVLTASSPNVT